MANKGDVDLVIRAKNEASKSLDTISKALDDLDRKQQDVGGSAGKTGSLLDQFAKTIGVVATAYDRLQSDADRAAQSFSRQEASLNETKVAYTALTAQLEAAQRVQARMANFVGPMPKGSEVQTQLVAKAIADLSAQSEKLGRNVDTQTEQLTKSFYALEEITGGSTKAAEALTRVQTAHRQAADAADADAAAQARAAEATLKAAQAQQQLAQRRTALDTKRDLTTALASAQSGQQASQAGVKSLADEMAQNGSLSSDQVAQMARLTAQAAAYKAATNELRTSIELYNRVLRDSSATQEQVAAAQERAKASLAGAMALTQQQANATRSSVSAQREKVAATNEEASASQKLDTSLQSLFANSRRSLSLYQRWRGEVLSLVSSYLGLMAAIQGVNQTIQASLSMQATESRLNVVTGGDPAKTAQEMKWAVQEAERLGFAIDTLGQEWSKFAVAAQASNFSMQEARKIFISVTEAGRVLKLSSQTMSQAFVAVTQMMSKGTIQMEELRQQLGEHIPGAFAMMAKAADVSAAELTKMMEKGQLTSDYLLKFADVLDQRFGGQLEKSLKMTQAEMGRFQTAMTVALNEIADAGVIDGFTAALRRLQAILKSDDAHVWFQRIGEAAGGVIKLLMAVLDNLDLIIAAFAALGAAKGAAYVVSLTQALMGMVAAIRAASTAGAALNVALGGLGGPIGLAIGVLAGAFAFLAMRVSEADKAMQNAKRTSDDLVASYNMGSSTPKAMADAAEKLSELQIERTRGTLQKKLADEIKGLGSNLSTTIYTEFGQAIEIPASPNIKPLQDLVDAVKSGAVPLSEFKAKLDEIGKENPELKKLAISLQDQAESALKTDSALSKFEASLRLAKGTASDMDKKLLGVASGIEDSGDAAATAARNMERYTQAMENLGKQIPELKKELDLQTNIKAIQQAFSAALAAAGKDIDKINAAKDRALQAIASVRQAYDEALIKQAGSDRGDMMLQSVNLLKSFEGYQPTGKWDVNAYRAGYGSDTVTLSDGSIQKITEGMAVSQNDALRDLVRRIGEFQDVIKTQVGADRFNAFTAPQQAALTSIAYNYGRLPKDIVEAIKYGSNEGIAQAVRNHAGDNLGVNAGRRNREADILSSASPGLVALTQRGIDARQDRVTKVLQDLDLTLREAKLGARDKFIEEALKKAQPTDVNAPRLTSEQEQTVRSAAGGAFDAQQEIAVKQKNIELENKLRENKASTNKEEFIALEAQKQRVDLSSEEGKKWAELQSQLWERENAEKRVNELVSLRQQLLEKLALQQNMGDTSGVNDTTAALEAVNSKLTEAIEKGKAFWQTMGDNPQSQAALLNLDNLNAKVQQGSKKTLDAKQINESFTSAATTGFMSVGESLGGWIDGTKTGSEAIAGMRDAFLTFAADFLKQIAQMILQQAIFNMISGASSGAGGGGGGLGGAITGALGSIFHTGGVVGGPGEGRTVSPSIFAGAMRYHTGGVAGLQPNEVPAILQRGEEVLTANDPRHSANGGGASKSPVNLKIVNVIDSGQAVSEGLSTAVGEEAFMNMVQANKNKLRTILS